MTNGLCECGCGRTTTIIKATRTKLGQRRGAPHRFARGHTTKTVWREPSSAHLCECGCGQETTIIKTDNQSRGLVKGQRRRYINGHNRIKRGIGTQNYAVEDRGFGTFCWIWLGALNNKGYGHITRQGRRLQTHRVMWEQMRGPIPAGLQIDHLCKVRACCNPDHLEPVTHLENVRRSSRTRISREDVRSMVEARQATGETYASLGQRFGCSTTNAWRLVTEALRDAAISP